MASEKTADPRTVAGVLAKQLNKGKGILKHQPVARETCEEWTAATRELLAEIFGPDAPVVRDFIAANRKIFTSYDTDPSYYLTQVVANLHRELLVLEKCVQEKQREAEAAEALLALKGRGKRKAPPRIPVFVWAEKKAAAGQVLAVLEEEGFDPLAAPYRGTNAADALWTVASRRDLRYGIVVVSDGSGKGAGLSADGLLVTGYLNGRFGRGRVLVLLDTKQPLPATARLFRAYPLADRAAWRQEITKDAAKLRGG